MPDEDSNQLQEVLKQLAAEEIGQGFGQWYIELFASDQSVIFWDREITCHYFYTNRIPWTRTYYYTPSVSKYI